MKLDDRPSIAELRAIVEREAWSHAKLHAAQSTLLEIAIAALELRAADREFAQAVGMHAASAASQVCLDRNLALDVALAKVRK